MFFSWRLHVVGSCRSCYFNISIDSSLQLFVYLLNLFHAGSTAGNGAVTPPGYRWTEILEAGGMMAQDTQLPLLTISQRERERVKG